MEKNCENVVPSELIGMISGHKKPLKITFLPDQKQIIIGGFDKMETLTEADCEGTQLSSGDIMLTDNNDEILGYIMIG